MSRTALLRALVLVAGACAVLGLASRRPVAHGDSGEYLLMTEALARHRTPDIRPGDMAGLGAIAAERGIDGAFGGLQQGILPGRGGRAWSIHFWAYPLSVVPMRLLLDAVGGHPLAAAQVTNALWLMLALWAVARLAPDATHAGTGVLLTLLGPAVGYVVWPHPEVFTFAMVTIGVAAAGASRWTLATLALAIASTQAPPLVPVALAAAVRLRPARALAALGPAFVPPLFDLWALGTPSPLHGRSATLDAIALGKAADLVVDLDIGLLPYAPGVVLLALAALARRDRPALLAWMAAAVAALGASAALSWNSASCGPSRYAVWLYPFVAAAAARCAGSRAGRLALAGAFAAQLAITSARVASWGAEDQGRHSYAARFVLDCWPSLYSPHPQVWMARTPSSGGSGPFVWRGPEGRCRKALAQKRHLSELRSLCGPLPETFPESARRERRAWRYVDFPAAAPVPEQARILQRNRAWTRGTPPGSRRTP